MNSSNHPFSDHKSHSLALWRMSVFVIVTYGVLLPSPCSAQSAANFDTSKITPKVQTPVEMGNLPSIPANEAGPINTTPSRYISEKEIVPYVQAVAAVLSIRNRATDPFGQAQDPNAPPKIDPNITKTPRRVTHIQATPFVDIVNQIKVTTIMPMEKRFLVGTRSIKQGQQFPINFRSKNINIKVISVSSRQIEFRNLDSGETAALSLNLLPAGIAPGTKGINAPGMQKNFSEAPLEVEDGANSSNKGQISNP